MAKRKTDCFGNYISDSEDLDIAIGSLPFIRGVWYFVDPKDGSDLNDGLTPGGAFANLRAAYDACTDGAGDGIVLISAGTTAAHCTSYLSYPIAWSKSQITVWGTASPTGFFSRSRIANVEHTTGSISVLAFVAGADTTYDKITRTTGSFVTNGFVAGDVIRVNTTGNGADATGLVVKTVEALTLTLTTIGTLVTETAANAGASVVNSYCAPMITMTGSNNRWYNVAMYNGSTDAAALGALAVGANKNYFENCHFVGAGSTTPGAVATCYDLKLYASECRFVECTFGTNSTLWAANNGHIYLGNSTTQIGQNFFERCKVISDSATAGHGAIILADAATLGGWIQFSDCTFVNWQSGALTALTTVIIGATPNNCGILLHNCGQVGWAAWMANNDKHYTTNAAGAAGTGGIGGTID